MLDELQWFVMHVFCKRIAIRSQRSPQALLVELSAKVSPRPSRRQEIVAGLVGEWQSSSIITFDEFGTDFDRRGTEAIDAQGLWGRVWGSSFEIEIAAGLGAQRWWIPRMDGDVVPGDLGGAVIRCQIRGVQRRQILVTVVALGMSIAAVCIGLALIASGSALIGAIFALAVGSIMLTLMLWFLRTAARIANGMEHSLIQRLERLANESVES
jgi:hypothetical protein